MKLSFSTNGWHSFGWSDFTAMACELGFNGIEVHDILNDSMSAADAPFESS